MTNKVKQVNFENLKRIIKSPFKISIWIVKVFQLLKIMEICKPFTSYLGKDIVCNFNRSVIKESKYSSDVFKKYFSKELVIKKRDTKDFENSTNCWICEIDHVDNEVKAKDHCPITGNYRGSAQRDCNINVKLKHKLFLVFLNLKNYDSRLITQELGKFNLKINAISNELKEDRILSINNNFSFIDTSQFLSFP